ncbi:DNA-binding response regulator, OmpR family, contains REC and winged-helix (wHTH) domain [Tenacibaculum sp. MAR_2009_124]|uniref:response regulator n=1 Tax=Tenacibaculum sp. MAR_2009_124 TaxID=1250059 RepID=UPI000894529D|nr:response regulator [Tenacibaculum sp. MAR_2009_124]SEB52229.1 DNA-binding response regulator, OmpR family, contains REC and winged-helix (wHTH) domain [Tenacibaculum sp. MAR_2009_124]
MKVLVIDDEKLVLLPIEKRLKAIGYEVETESNGIKGINLFDSFQPDLVIIDIHLPEISGFEIVEHIRKRRGKDTPIMMLSGSVDDESIMKGFDLGINDYMKKPLSLNEICARTKRLIGQPVNTDSEEVVLDKIMIQKRSVGVVIPCYNEEERLLQDEFLSFLDENSGYYLCFVNDGSSDNTLKVLENLRKGREDFIKVYNCEKNGGKAEAVRQGMLYLARNTKLDYIGFLDADLSTDFNDFDDLVKTIENSDFKIVGGSRIQRMGANIAKDSARAIISKTINFIIRTILSMDFKDTQCGAKIFDRKIVPLLFEEKFLTKWLFDVELFMRMKKEFTLPVAKQIICEQPLKRWVHVDGSKLSMKDSLKIIFQLGQIAYGYSDYYYERQMEKKNIKFDFYDIERKVLKEKTKLTLS